MCPPDAWWRVLWPFGPGSPAGFRSRALLAPGSWLVLSCAVLCCCARVWRGQKAAEQAAFQTTARGPPGCPLPVKGCSRGLVLSCAPRGVPGPGVPYWMSVPSSAQHRERHAGPVLPRWQATKPRRVEPFFRTCTLPRTRHDAGFWSALTTREPATRTPEMNKCRTPLCGGCTCAVACPGLHLAGLAGLLLAPGCAWMSQPATQPPTATCQAPPPQLSPEPPSDLKPQRPHRPECRCRPRRR